MGQRLTRPKNDFNQRRYEAIRLAGKRGHPTGSPFSLRALVMMVVMVMVMMVVVMPPVMMVVMMVTELDRNLGQSGPLRSLRLRQPRIVGLQ
jgi:hypothetical protein